MGSIRDRRLNSWKEIAGYLGRDLRTVQRWEGAKGLPVYRVPGGKRQAVFAYQGEIDRWLQAGGGDAEQAGGTRAGPDGGAPPRAALGGTAGEPAGNRMREIGGRRYWFGIAAGIVLTLAAGLAAYPWLRSYTERKTGREPPEKQLTANPPEDRVVAAAISPDGKHLAYLDLAGLFLRTIDSGETRAIPLPLGLSSSSGSMLQWFPDGGKLLVEVPASEGEIWVIPMLGAASPHLVHRHAVEPAISPDGRSIAFINGEIAERGKELWVCGINGESPRRLASANEFLGLWNPVWSPDGRWIAYWRTKGRHPISVAIEVRPAGGGPERTLAPESSLPKTNWLTRAVMSWSCDWRLIWALTEDSERLAGSQGDGSIWALRTQPTNGQAQGKPERLARWTDWVVGHVSITADGKRLALVRPRPRNDVYLGELERGGSRMNVPHRFTLDTRGSNVNGWTSDSRAVVYESCRNGKWEVFRQALKETVPDMVIESSGNAWSGALSPDGAWYLYWEEPAPTAPRDTRPGRLMRRRVAGGSPEMVLEEPTNDLLAFKCPLEPSSACVLSRKEGNDMGFYPLDPLLGKGDRIASIEVKTDLYGGVGKTDWSVSPDGSRLAVVDARPRIAVFTRSDKNWRQISVEGWGVLSSIDWTADGKGFYAISWLSGSHNLLHVMADGDVQRLYSKGEGWLLDPRPSPDGKHLAFGVETFDSNVWMIENF